MMIMVVAKNFLKNAYVQATLEGLKSCVIGVILATGVYMIFDNCIIKDENHIDITSILITCGLAVVYFGMRKVRKNGISPIGLICIAAVVGVVVYGI